jgi:outer membrane lipoprotein-sorting protein
MVKALFTTILAAAIAFIPNAHAVEKKLPTIPEETELDIPLEAKAIKKNNKKQVKVEEAEGVITLRKAKKEKSVRYIRNKKGKIIAIKAKDDSKTEFEDENLDSIYKKERAYFNGRGPSSKRHRSSGNVSGPLASIPLAVANALAMNTATARAERMPAPPPPPEAPKVQTAEEFLNVEKDIQESKGEVNNNSKEKLALKLPSKKVEARPKSKKEFKVIKEVEVKDEVASEVQLVEVDQSKHPEKEVPRTPASAKADALDSLNKIEKKYVTHFIKINVNSEVTQALLERSKTYSGQLFLAPESRFKLDVKEPNKHMLLMNGKNIWVVDYPLDETQDKVQILHSTSAKSLKNQAFLDIFTGVGNLQKRFKIESSDKKDDEITYKLIPKKKDEQVERVELELDVEAELISTITFWDSLGNKTHLKFSKQEFDDKTPKDIFDFTPPKDASITNL